MNFFFLQSTKTGDNVEQCVSTSNFPSDHQESFHHKSGPEFVDNVQSHCKSIMERMRVIKGSVNGFSEDKDSVVSRENNAVVDTSPESTIHKAEGQTSSGMDSQEQCQKIKERIQKIVELVRSTAQKVS